MLACGLALGIYKDPEEITQLRSNNDFITGNMPSDKVTALYDGWNKAVKRAKN